ncbi:DUF3800 domain-containing protein [Macrococcoides goetzii]|nr:DUF3800 domain-containing protein [Macrococcus goetzii]TDM40254.1 DUF3800 domain-containing protein [Macrococcus goetzii]
MRNLYCDESCHLENDNCEVMVIGGIITPQYSRFDIYQDIRQIKIKHGLKKDFEIKWTKISKSKLDFYKELIEYFFENELLEFRGVILPNKRKLDHNRFNQTHDEFYYKMYFYTVMPFMNGNDDINVYMDIKDTNGGNKIKKLKEIINNASYAKVTNLNNIQLVRSHENEILQLADLLIGCLSYANRYFKTENPKQEIVDLVAEKSGVDLRRKTPINLTKFNLLVLDYVR